MTCKKCDFDAPTPLELARHSRSAHKSRRRRVLPPPEPERDGELTMIDSLMTIVEAAQIDAASVARALVYVADRFGVALQVLTPVEAD